MANDYNILDFTITGGSLRARKNILINAAFRINQRVYVSGTNTSGANEYTLDRWRVVTSGENVTFSALGTDNTLTVPSGGYATEVEARDVVGGTYIISWTGTSTCKVGGVDRVNGESFTATANTDLIVQFSNGTLKQPQLELGATSTDFEFVNIAGELTDCQRYYERGGEGKGLIYEGDCTSGSDYNLPVLFRVSKRATPTISLSNKGSFGFSTSQTVNDKDTEGFRIQRACNSTGAARSYQTFYIADAEL